LIQPDKFAVGISYKKFPWDRAQMKMAPLNDTLPGYKAPAIHKAFHLLRAVAESPRRMSLTDLALQLGYSKSTTHGLVHALMREGALVLGPDGHKLYLGPTVINLVLTSWNYIRMVDSVQPIIDSLRDQIKETMVLGALIHNHILIIAAAEAVDPFRIAASPGTVLPLFAGAAGKVFHAAKTDHEVAALIREKGLPQHTSNSIIDEEKYLADLEQVRSNRYSVDHGEYLAGVSAVALALNNLIGPPMAVWAVGLSSNMGADKVEHAIGIMNTSLEGLRSALDKSTEH
jgi:DNA-binding IclR family transcriptional regulator